MVCASPVCITGLGAVSAIGMNCAATLEGLHSGQRHPVSVDLFETPLDKPVFQVRGPLPDDTRTAMRTIRLALLAADEALADAQFQVNSKHACVGVCLGTTVACQLNDIEFYRRLREGRTVSMDAVDRYLRSNLSAAVAARYGFTGPTLTIANACSSGTDAIGTALAWLRQGACDAVLAGGADELNRIPLAGFNALGIMSDMPCRPFDRDRKGLTLGEGAGILLLETAAAATRRHAELSLTCLGYGTYGDAHHLTAPRADGSGLEAAIHRALAEAALSPEDIAFINAHGTATATNDAVEGSVLARVFGSKITVSTTKGFTGHTLGAAGGLEAVFTALALREGWIPPSAGFQNRDPSLPLAPVERLTALKGHYALSTSLAFGGNNSALVLGRYR